jgi:hypothetical protein
VPAAGKRFQHFFKVLSSLFHDMPWRLRYKRARSRRSAMGRTPMPEATGGEHYIETVPGDGYVLRESIESNP